MNVTARAGPRTELPIRVWTLVAGVALVDIDAWRWLYDHPEATPAEFRAAVVQIAQDVWNRHYAPLFGVRDVPLLGIYSHLVVYGLYMPDYPIGHLIEFQLEEFFRGAKAPLGAEFERVAKQGQLTPDAWMRGAVGGPLSAEPLLAAFLAGREGLLANLWARSDWSQLTLDRLLLTEAGSPRP